MHACYIQQSATNVRRLGEWTQSRIQSIFKYVSDWWTDSSLHNINTMIPPPIGMLWNDIMLVFDFGTKSVHAEIRKS